MEYCGGGDLFEKLVNTNGNSVPVIFLILSGNVTEKNAAAIMAKLFSACAYIHGKGIAHRDIKPENIMLNTAGEIKIVDWGVSKKFSEDDVLQGIDM